LVEKITTDVSAQISQGKKADLKKHGQLVLASASPRRLALLEQVGIVPNALRPTTIDETPAKAEMPRTLVNRLALAKAETARKIVRTEDELSRAYILAADTVVAVGRRVLAKPETAEEAAASLYRLSARSHRVYTSICLITPDDKMRNRLVETRVKFMRLTREDINAYLATGEWRDKAGGYAIQGFAAAFITGIKGSYTNVVGLPLRETINLLRGEHYPVYFNWLSRGHVDGQ
jgi:septum formation protein